MAGGSFANYGPQRWLQYGHLQHGTRRKRWRKLLRQHLRFSKRLVVPAVGTGLKTASATQWKSLSRMGTPFPFKTARFFLKFATSFLAASFACA
jgi:hypothetical protein